MAITIALASQGHNSLRYVVTYDGAAGTSSAWSTTGAASPDLLTDSLSGPLKALARAFTTGYGAFAAGALTQAQARALWLSNLIGGTPGTMPVTAKGRVTLNQGSTATLLTLDADVDGSGHPVLRCAISGTTGTAAIWFVDFFIEGAIGT